MLKNISNLKGAKVLNREEQKQINGGKFLCTRNHGEGPCITFDIRCAQWQCKIYPGGW